MRWPAFPGSLILASVISAPAPAAAELTVLVYNYAALPRDALAGAKHEAARILADAGLATVWPDCPLGPAEAALYPQCPSHARPDALSLRLMRSGAAARMVSDPKDPHVFGFSLRPPGGPFGNVAVVLTDRVEELAGGGGAFYAVLLGHIIAHELGHLLLADGKHSAGSIMSHSWRRRELERVAQGAMLFTADQQRRMQEQIRRRRGDRLLQPGIGRSPVFHTERP